MGTFLRCHKRMGAPSLHKLSCEPKRSVLEIQYNNVNSKSCTDHGDTLNASCTPLFSRLGRKSKGHQGLLLCQSTSLQCAALTLRMTDHTWAGSSPLNCCWVEGGWPGRTAALALWLTEATSCSRALMVFCTIRSRLGFFFTLEMLQNPHLYM